MASPTVDRSAAQARLAAEAARRRAEAEARRRAEEAQRLAARLQTLAQPKPPKDELSTGRGSALRTKALSLVDPGARPLESSAPTFSPSQLQGASTLRTEVKDDGQANCLERAATLAGPNDSVVLFADRKDAVGHAVVQRGDGSVVDPNAPETPYASVQDFQQKNPRYTDPLAVKGAELQRVLDTPPGAQRDAVIGALGLSKVADRQVADPSNLDVSGALRDVKAAQEAVQRTQGTTSVDHAYEQLAEAQKKLRSAIESSCLPLDQVNAAFASQSTDPAERLAVAEATATLARERADAVAQRFGLGPNDEGRDHKPGHDESRAARTLEGRTRDQLTQIAEQEVSKLRAQGLSREEALEQLKQGAGPMTAEVLSEKAGVPNTIGMTPEEKHQTYERIFLEKASPEAKAAYERGEKVVLALRHDSPVYANGGKGEFDDRFVVMQKDGMAKEYAASLDPNLQYGNGLRDEFDVPGKPENWNGTYAEHHDDSGFIPWDSDTVNAWGRISGGQTIRMQTGPHGKLYPPPDGGYRIDGDLNGDGVFNDGVSKEVDGNGYQLHGSAVGHTGSGGCITVPFYRWDEFHADVTSGQPTVDGDERAAYVVIA